MSEHFEADRSQLAIDRLVIGKAPDLVERYRELGRHVRGGIIVLRASIADEPIGSVSGVDESQRTRLHELVDAELSGLPLDLLIDDRSRPSAPTRASFEALFPMLSPRGVYVVADWNADHRVPHPSAPATSSSPSCSPAAPLSRLVFELVLARASSDGAVEEVTVDEHWISVRRGHSALDRATFRVDQLYTDHFDQLDPELTG